MAVKFTSTISLTAVRGIAVNPDMGHLLICDANRLVRATMQGVKSVSTLTFIFADSAEIPYTISTAQDALYHKGYYYVSLAGNHLVGRFRASDMAEKGYFGTPNVSGSSTSTLNAPKALTTDGEFLYIADSGNNRIMKLTLSTLEYSSASSTSIGAYSLAGVSGIVYKKEAGEALFINKAGTLIKCETDFTFIEGAVTDPVAGNTGITYLDDYVYVPIASVINVYTSDGLTLTTTLSHVVNNVVAYNGALYATDVDNVFIVDAYRPRDSFTQGTPIKIGGNFFDNPFVILGEDSLVVGATQESSPNYWKEENKTYSGLSYVEEDTVSSTWTEESAVSSSWTEES